MPKVISGERVGKQGRLAVGCSAAVFDADRQSILLVRRADNGRWDVPGGYMEAGEGVTEACAREVLEETGLQVQVKRLISVYTNPHLLLEYSDGNHLQLVVLHFETESIGGHLKSNEETSELKYFSQSETAELEMTPLGRLRVNDAFAAQEAAIIRDTF
ncbi:MAG: NUDIX domain-containing protein [Chloroflexota bacterium]